MFRPAVPGLGVRARFLAFATASKATIVFCVYFNFSTWGWGSGILVKGYLFLVRCSLGGFFFRCIVSCGLKGQAKIHHPFVTFGQFSRFACNNTQTNGCTSCMFGDKLAAETWFSFYCLQEDVTPSYLPVNLFFPTWVQPESWGLKRLDQMRRSFLLRDVARYLIGPPRSQKLLLDEDALMDKTWSCFYL